MKRLFSVRAIVIWSLFAHFAVCELVHAQTLNFGKKPNRESSATKAPAFLPATDEGVITSSVRRVPVNVQSVPTEILQGAQSGAAQQKNTAETAQKLNQVSAFYNENGTLRHCEGKVGVLKNRVSKNLEVATPYSLVGNAKTRAVDAETRAAKQEPAVQEALALLAESKILRGLQNPEEELATMSLNKDALGFQHIRFEQMYKGLRVHGRDIIVHINHNGDVYSVHGLYEPTPKHDVSATPALTQESAFIATRNALAEEGLWKNMPQKVLEYFGAERAWKGELLWFPAQMNTNQRGATSTNKESALQLAYAITITTSINRSWTYFIDATTGETLASVRLHRDDQDFLDRFRRSERNDNYAAMQTEAAKTSTHLFNEAPSAALGNDGAPLLTPTPKNGSIAHSTGFQNIAATTLFREQLSVRSWQRSSDGRIFPVSDYGAGETPDSLLPQRVNGGSLVIDMRNTEDVETGILPFITSGQVWRGDIAAALSYTDSCRRYFALRHSRPSWNGQNGRIHTLLNYGMMGSRSAWWNAGLLSQGYGDGGGVQDARNPNRDLFIYGHEVGHAYNSLARLEYNNGETGALEEHYANVWGWMIDRSSNYYSPRLPGFGNVPGEGLHWGSLDSTGPGWSRIGNVRDFYVFGSARAQGLQFPHCNAGIPDRVSWLFFNRFGRDTTERVWWRTLSTYMTQNSGFGDFRRNTLRAAADLFPGNTAMIDVLNAAFDDVGITATMVASRKISDGAGSEAHSVSSVVAFTTQAGRIGLYNPATNRASLFAGNDAVVRTQGGRSQVSAATNGRLLYFVNTRGQVSRLDLLNSTVTAFPGIQIRQAGDVASTAISPDGTTLLLTSQYPNDPNFYIATVATIASAGITRVRAIPLQRLIGETTRPISEGKQVTGVRYPDALAWSPDSRTPEVVFDAYHEFKVGNDTIPFWALYYAGLSGNPRVFELYPPQPDFNLGFPSYSSRNANKIVFSEYFPQGNTIVNDLYVANFDQDQDVGYLGMSNFRVNNRPITDADQAVFSPDDRQLCFTSAASPRSLMFYTFTSGTVQASLRAITLDSSVVRPFWANLDNATSVREEDLAKGTALSLEITPNPASALASVQFVVPLAHSRVTLTLLSMLGQEVVKVVDAVLPQGDHSLPFSTEALPSGVYLCRLQVGEAVAVKKVSVVR
ncbi:MAG: T9SS C-terminal target domain-containing protein [Candidatus Kapaibacterium sp.]|nr:MAG: T9SS C-terminal target domain-containing protein [Candidatus Kapabacteria bacterium]